MAVTQLKDGRWICYYRIRENGKSRIKKEYFGRGPAGETKARDRDQALGLRKTRPRKTIASGPIFAELSREYIQQKNFSENSEKHLRIRLTANILPHFGDMPAIRIDFNDLDRYVKKRRQKVKFSTVRRELTDVRAILNWSVARRPSLIPFNPIHAYKIPAPDDAVILPPTQEETNSIIKAASPHLKRAIMLSYYLGLRPGAVELLSLTWHSVIFETLSIRVMSAHKGGPIARDVPIHPDFIETLRKWYKEDKKKGPIIHWHGKAVRDIKKSWRGALKKAKVKRRLRPYDLRHSFVTKALEGGADLKALSEIVGSRPETIMRYYQHVTKDIHRQTVAKIPPLDSG